MSWNLSHRWRPAAWIAVCAVGIALVAPVSATAATPAPEAAPYAAFDTVPRERADVPTSARVVRMDGGGGSEFGYSRRSMDAVVDAASKTVLLQTVNADGTLDASVDLGGVLDTVRGGFNFNEWERGNVLNAIVWGSKDGAPVIVRVTSTQKRTFDGSSIAVVNNPVIDPARLTALAPSGAGLLAVLREDDGTYVAQRTDYALSSAVGAEIVLDLPAASDRRFAIDRSYDNIISSRDGGVDVISRYAPETVHSVEVEGLGLADTVDLVSGTAAVADADGDVAVFSLDFSATHKLLTRTKVDGAPRALAIADGLEEVLIVTATGDTIERLSTSQGAAPLEPLRLNGVEIVPSSLESNSWSGGGSFSAVVGDRVYRYTTTQQRAASIFVYDGRQTASISEPAQRGDGMTWSFAASGTGDLAATWEYSLDGGANWSARDSAWDTASPDSGDERYEPAALPAPLDGVAPAVRTAVDSTRLVQTSTFSRSEYDIALPAALYDAQWRVRVTSALSSVVSTPQTFALSGEIGSPAPRVTRHPASTSVAQSTSTTLQAEATGSPAPTIAWERSFDGGATWAVLSGATSTSLTVSGRVHEDGALYRAVFANASGSLTTEAARVTVTSPPALAPGAASNGALVATGAALAFDLSTYAHDWLRAVHGADVRVASGEGFEFGAGTGWIVPSTGEAQISWTGAAVYKPYGGMNGLHVTFANPYLAVGADGRGTVTADVAWNNGGGMFGSGGTTESAGSRRVVIATFADAEVSVDGATATFRGTPEWNDRDYVKPGLADATVYRSSFPASFVDWVDDALRPWFLGTGSSRDGEKAGMPVTATFSVGTEAASGSGEPIDPVQPIEVAPRVTQRPLATTVAFGQTARLTATASGQPTPAVRWQRETESGWEDVPGANTTTLTLAGLPEGASRYRAVFTNRAAEVVSAAARVTVTAAEPEPEPTVAPTPEPEPTVAPTPEPEPTVAPEPEPTVEPEPEPTVAPTPEPEPTVAPTPEPEPTVAPTPEPEPTVAPEPEPTVVPTTPPTVQPTTPSTTPSPVPIDDARLTAATRGGVAAPSSAAAGDTVTVTVGGFAGTTVNVWLHSTPTLLVSAEVAADGTVRVVIPANTAGGVHRIVVTTSDGALVGWTDIRVTTRAALPATGGELPVGVLVAGLALVAVGGLAVVRRRRSVS